MGIFGRFQRLDEYLVAAHSRIADKVNDLFGLGHYRFAQIVNYSRWFFLLLIVGFLSSLAGASEPGLGTVLIVSLGIIQTLFCRDTIRIIRRVNKSDEESYEVMPRSWLYRGPDQASRLGLLVGILPTIGVNGLVGLLNRDWGLMYLLVNFGFSLDTTATSSVLYILAKPNQPKKGKLVLAFESFGNRLLSNLGWQRPQPAPQPND